MNKYISAASVSLILMTLCCERETPLLSDTGDTPEETTFTILNGEISGVLRESGSPYHATQELSVNSLQELTVEPGTRIFFDSDVKIIIKGKLHVRGEKRYPVLFTAYGSSGWGGIAIGSSSSAEFSFCTIEKINIDANDSSGYGAVLVTGSYLLMNNCIIENNRAVNGGGLYLNTSRGKISNNIFRSNYSEIFGGAILTEESSLEIINNLFYENEINSYGGTVVLINNDSSAIQNNIFYRNSIRYGDEEISIFGADSGRIDAAYNFFSPGGENPDFMGENDFHLTLHSPCRNAGNPDSEFNDFDGTRNDQGAYGVHQEIGNNLNNIHFFFQFNAEFFMHRFLNVISKI